MSDINVPDFESWSQQCWSPNRIAKALEEAFEQGIIAGRRQAEDWFEQLDKDLEEQARLTNPNMVQYLDKASGCYVAYNKKTSKEVGRRCGGKPFDYIVIVDSK